MLTPAHRNQPMQNVMIHYKSSLDNLNHLIDSDLFFTTTDDELQIIVDDKDLDNDQEFVTSYGLDYDQVNSIELI